MRSPLASPAFRLALVAAFSVALCGCPSQPDPSALPPPPTPPSTGQTTPLPLSVKNEELWIVESIARDIASLILYASDPGRPPLKPEGFIVERLAHHPSRYKIRIATEPPLESEILLNSTQGSIWNPARFSPFAEDLIKALAIEIPRPSAPQERTHAALLSTLSAPRIEHLLAENKRLSESLAASPLDVDTLEQAAFLASVFGLRENSGLFWDTRTANNRATAALALAEALRGTEARSDSAALAALLISLLDDTKKESQSAITRLQERTMATPSLKPWIRAAQLRNTRDWRLLPLPESATLIERIEYLRAVSETVSPESAQEWMAQGMAEEITDWPRIIFQFDFSVGQGKEFAIPAIARELKEITETFPDLRGNAPTFSADGLARVLNRAPGRLVETSPEGSALPRVIDDGMWAHFLQRHLCHTLYNVHHFLDRKLGTAEQAASFRTQMTSLCGQLTFFPLLEGIGFARNPSPDSRSAQATLISQHPEWITDAVWATCLAKSELPPLYEWFSCGLPLGTAYSFPSRVKGLDNVRALSLPELENLYHIAPWSYSVAKQYLMAKTGGHPTAAQQYEILGRFFDFNISAMLGYSRLVGDDPIAYAEIIQKAAKLDPFYHLRLFDYYKKRHQNAEAVAAYEEGLRHEANSIAAANRSEWVINHYYSQGKTEEALSLARWAAKVYSYRGLQAMANLAEKMNDHVVAEEHFRKIHERYEDAAPLYLYYERRAGGDIASPFNGKAHALISSTFPDGLSNATQADFSSPPTSGVIIVDESTILRNNGLARGDIITALDGRRVDTFPQYAFIRSLKETPAMQLVIYRKGKYLTIHANAPERRFKCNFETYTPSF